MRYLLLLFSLFFVLGCKDEVVVKPAAKLRLEYPKAIYDTVISDCPFSFEKNNMATLLHKKNCAINLHYPQMQATVYLTYQPIQNSNLDSLLFDAQKLTYDHNIKADAIFEQPRVDSINKVFGMFYMIDGNAATQSQFYVTDSLRHFMTGSVYFETKPNFDSLYPAVIYLRNDMRRIMETINWK
ncbi:gliding motility lipoprotein GldD [Constantimarinum furrinae]|uniref:Gliding motility protein GldD n=1 Tax=Constantimarinum furrinae TaxID=2562285 RepID=A0A7G8PSE8_9FLAO|nr:gliding motility lipoprotein GldD [Constantimarinum furrinae]QNJ97264.1 gliding motility protein GldD [Constantimarinum furrinae]